ncbi:MAG: M56 family metallopeptidase [Oscillatoria sp. SIO1A7]|nr:M56 family metallopeptidase [Oscillatoria sp. SIO1A7]
MHVLMFSIALVLSCCLRFGYKRAIDKSQLQPERVLLLFLFPPVLAIVTALAIVCMGPLGQMVWFLGWFSYLLAATFLAFAIVLCLQLAFVGYQTVRRIRGASLQNFQGTPARILDLSVPFSAQVGFWQPELVVTQGLIDLLDEEHLLAVIAHERAHLHYRDTFWFFWLGWIRRFSFWLPNTEILWQELLLWREMRADRWAAQQVDFLLLAESLIYVVQTPLVESESFCAAFSCAAPQNRLSQRIDALLSHNASFSQWNWQSLTWLFLAFVPLLVIPFHY